MNSPELREAYQACLGQLSDYSTWIGQHEGLFRAWQALRDGPAWASLDEGQRRTVENALRDFRLAGVDLPAEQKRRYGEIKSRLSELSNTFSNQLLDATQAWHLDLADAGRLAGLPESALATLEANAEAKGLEGYRITLDFPSFFPVMTYAEDRALRREVYTAFVTRASNQGPHAGEYDNAPVMEEILALRHELAGLLGFADYADYSLATKMAESPTQVITFLEDLASRAVPQAREEFAELAAFARDELGMEALEPWDVGFASEKLREARYAISDEQLRPYFPAPRVVDGLFRVVERLYGVTFAEDETAPRYHPDVRYFQILEQGAPIAGFYLDLYAREGKRGGAWMDECRVRRLEAGEVQLPVAYLTCNFTRPVGDAPALLTHDEVTTLFHEFGHGLHHMLTRQTVADISGINGVAWDAVELPSQFMENFCWEREGLDLIAGHVETGEPLPEALFEKLIAAKNFQSAMGMVRQLEFSLFDFRLHREHAAPRPGRSRRCSTPCATPSRWCREQRSTASRTASATSSPAATRRATTATSGPRCSRRTPGAPSRRPASSTPRPGGASAPRSSSAAAPGTPPSCSAPSAAASPASSRCCATAVSAPPEKSGPRRPPDRRHRHGAPAQPARRVG